jgi:hypothetical protein
MIGGRNLKLKKSVPTGGPPAKRRGLLDEVLDCYQVQVWSPPVSECDVYVHGQAFAEDVQITDIDEETVKSLVEPLSS